MPYRFQRPCLDCGELSLSNRCERHQQIHARGERRRLDLLPKKSKEEKARYYDRDYQARAKDIKQNANECYLCGKRFSHSEKQSNKIQADHVYPSLGNNSPLLAAHASCNRQKGNKDFDLKDFPNSTFQPKR